MKLADKVLTRIGWPLARMFIAGKKKEDALGITQELNKQGLEGIINFLGEAVEDQKQAHDNVYVYRDIIKQIHLRKLKARISIKPSQLGLKIDPRLYWFKLRWIARDAFLYNVPLEIDIEAEDTVAHTIENTVALINYYPGLDVRQALAINFKESFCHLYNLTVVGVKVRLCKGAYPSQYTEKKIRERFLHAVSYLLRHKANPDFATHDFQLLRKIFELRNEYPATCGFQFLFGLRKKTWKELAEKNERVAVYVPFGIHWLPYAKRRWKYILKKLPSIILGN